MSSAISIFDITLRSWGPLHTPHLLLNNLNSRNLRNGPPQPHLARMQPADLPTLLRALPNRRIHSAGIHLHQRRRQPWTDRRGLFTCAGVSRGVQDGWCCVKEWRGACYT
jgi:hypothetical protein